MGTRVYVAHGGGEPRTVSWQRSGKGEKKAPNPRVPFSSCSSSRWISAMAVAAALMVVPFGLIFLLAGLIVNVVQVRRQTWRRIEGMERPGFLSVCWVSCLSPCLLGLRWNSLGYDGFSDLVGSFRF